MDAPSRLMLATTIGLATCIAIAGSWRRRYLLVAAVAIVIFSVSTSFGGGWGWWRSAVPAVLYVARMTAIVGTLSVCLGLAAEKGLRTLRIAAGGVATFALTTAIASRAVHSLEWVLSAALILVASLLTVGLVHAASGGVRTFWAVVAGITLFCVGGHAVAGEDGLELYAHCAWWCGGGRGLELNLAAVAIAALAGAVVLSVPPPRGKRSLGVALASAAIGMVLGMFGFSRWIV